MKAAKGGFRKSAPTKITKKMVDEMEDIWYRKDDVIVNASKPGPRGWSGDFSIFDDDYKPYVKGLNTSNPKVDWKKMAAKDKILFKVTYDWLMDQFEDEDY
jgi:hypothetical protein